MAFVESPSTKVQLHVHGRHLKKLDLLSKSDPMVVVYLSSLETGGKFQEVDRSEVVKNCHDPDWAKTFHIQYMFEEQQKLRFDVYDSDGKTHTLDDHDFIGSLETTIAHIVGVGHGGYSEALQYKGKSGDRGTLYVTAEEEGASKGILHMQFAGQGLDKKDLFGKSDPFLTFYRANGVGSFTPVHKTEVVKKTLNPTWKEVIVPLSVFCNGDLERDVKIDCHDWDSDGSHDLIGTVIIKTSQIINTKGLTFELINPKKRAKKKSYKNSGVLQLSHCTKEDSFSFLDFVQGGIELAFTAGIDFTGSNGNPANPSSLHYNNPYSPNQYVCALQAVGAVVEEYDTDKLIPGLGFGGMLPGTSTVSHEFSLTGDASNPYCAGVAGLIEAYTHSLQTVGLSGPTYFAPLINHVARFAQEAAARYYILLIITDGAICDMRNTKQAIVEASYLPMSIIIVGVGNADFSSMDVLDGDGQRLAHGGKYADRDIVQFVPFNKFSGSVGPARLAKEVLAEVPHQLTSYMAKHKIKPKPPVAMQIPVAQPIAAPHAAAL